ncbi:MAG: hypothetical protein FJZ87_03895 [Chloroflexi bacterium]|nr:hypothetical protein [Chloroflexota bacterium]
MALLVSALNFYRPQIEYGETAGWRTVAELLSARSAFSTSDVIGVLTGLQDAVLHFNLRGRGVKLEGLGTYLPNINYSGKLDVAYRLDRRLRRDLNAGEFTGRIRNRRSIGMTTAEVIARWNTEHPDDPVVD